MLTVYLNILLMLATAVNVVTAIYGWRARKRLIKAMVELADARDRINIFLAEAERKG